LHNYETKNCVEKDAKVRASNWNDSWKSNSIEGLIEQIQKIKGWNKKKIKALFNLRFFKTTLFYLNKTMCFYQNSLF
jgi:hypothetical protein